jgi:hypothetical protein
VTAPAVVPPLLVGIADDAVLYPHGHVPLEQALAWHTRHLDASHAALLGPLMVPVADLAPSKVAGEMPIGLVGPARVVDSALSALPEGAVLRQVESPVAKRGEDPLPGLRDFLVLLADSAVPGYAEIPLTHGLIHALDEIVEARGRGFAIAPKFRVGGLAAELFPSTAELAAVICACHERDLRFKLTGGLHHAIRHTDPDTGFTDHGFVNVLIAAAAAATGADPPDVAELLGRTTSLVEVAHQLLEQPRSMFASFDAYSLAEVVADLRTLALLPH